MNPIEDTATCYTACPTQKFTKIGLEIKFSLKEGDTGYLSTKNSTQRYPQNTTSVLCNFLIVQYKLSVRI